MEPALCTVVGVYMSALDVQVGGDHYRKMAIQPIVFITANNLGFCEGNAIKYLCRWQDKGGVADLEKAKHYIDLLLETQADIKPDMRCM
jgi:hypothetical protein